MKYIVRIQITNVGRVGSITIPPNNQFEVQQGDALVYCIYEVQVNGNYLPQKDSLQPIVENFGVTRFFRVSEVVQTMLDFRVKEQVNNLAIVVIDMWGHREAVTTSHELDNWASRIFDGLEDEHCEFNMFTLTHKSMKKPACWIDTDSVSTSCRPSKRLHTSDF